MKFVAIVRNHTKSVVERYFDLRNIAFAIMVRKVISCRRKVQIHRPRELVTRKRGVRRIPEMSREKSGKEAEVIQQCHSTEREINEMHFHGVHTTILADY